MAVTSVRMLAGTFALAILLAVCTVSFEVGSWSWGVNSRIYPLKTLFADAARVPGDSVAHLADSLPDIENAALQLEKESEAPAEVRGEVIPTDSESQNEEVMKAVTDEKTTEENEAGDEQRKGKPSFQTDAEEEPVTKEKLSPTDAESQEQKAVPEQHAQNVSKKERSVAMAPPPPPRQDETTSKRRNRAKTFLIVFMGHSGSTAFATELRTHTEFLVELLEPLEHGEYEFDTDKALERAKTIMDRGIAQGKIPGFKIRPFHIANKPEIWREFVREYDTRIIWQYRENIFKQAIGEYRNRFLNDSSVVEGLMADVEPCQKGSGQICRFKVENLRGLHSLMNEFSTSDELLAQAVRTFRRDMQMHIVRYEDYLYNREHTMREAFDFLGVDYQDTEPQRRKASPDNLCEMVINYQELCDRFVQCQLWRPYLRDERNDCRCKPGHWQPFDSSFCQRDAWYQNIKK